jgi:cytochrome c-type protein NapB
VTGDAHHGAGDETGILGIPVRWVQTIAALVIGVAFVGFLTGTRTTGAPHVWGAATGVVDAPVAGALATAPSHADLGTEEWRWMGDRQRGALAAMAEDRPAVSDERAAASDAELAVALAARASRRAYDGAPPRIPHPAPQQGALACLACHAEGLRVATLVAPAMSHTETAVCVSCHVEDEGAVPGGAAALASGPPIDNGFVGLEPPVRGPRAWDGAPPVIPHPTRMREACASCHGVLSDGLRTSHPYRQSCTQCHALSANFDLQPTAPLGPPAGGELRP